MAMTISGDNGLTFPAGSTQVQAGNFQTMVNRIINPRMEIDQRNAGASVSTTTTGTPTYTLDRWSYFVSAASKFTVQQNAGSVTPPVGFTNYLGCTSTSAYSVASGDYFLIRQAIEAYNMADLGWGTASAKTVTLSFQVYSSLTGTFGGALRNGAGNYSYPFSYSIPVANTWTSISVTIAGPTAGTWLTGNSLGIEVDISLGAGSTYNGTAGSWSANTYVSATGATSVVGTNGATFYITGVDLRVGSYTVVPQDFRAYGTELALCQRYFWKSTQNTSTNNAGVGYAIGCGNATFNRLQIPLPVQMRAVPTTTFSSVSLFNATSGAGISTSGFASYSSVNMISVDGNASSTTNPSGGSLLAYIDGANAYVSASAEL
jgi:hypothetical protein